jgi:hypothetical protein
MRNNSIGFDSCAAPEHSWSDYERTLFDHNAVSNEDWTYEAGRRIHSRDGVRSGSLAERVSAIGE